MYCQHIIIVLCIVMFNYSNICILLSHRITYVGLYPPHRASSALLRIVPFPSSSPISVLLLVNRCHCRRGPFADDVTDCILTSTYRAAVDTPFLHQPISTTDNSVGRLIFDIAGRRSFAFGRRQSFVMVQT